jgi:hypothetical protein
MADLSELIERVGGLHERIANDVPSIKRGIVWCTVCGRSQKVVGADCLRHGWPKCHGYTMTIDSPEERASLEKERG